MHFPGTALCCAGRRCGAGQRHGASSRAELLRVINHSENPARHRVLPPPGPPGAAAAQSGAGPLNRSG